MTYEMRIPELLKNRVLAGAEYLDTRMPDWRERVEVQTLQLSNPCRCVLGQIFTPVVQALPEAEDYLTYEYTDEGEYDGYAYATGKATYYDDFEEAESSPANPDDYISPEQCKLYAFDFPYNQGYTFEEMTEAWTRYLQGEL